MDDIDGKILRLLSANARMTLKELAGQVSLTSPAVAERIHRMERSGVIAGYTVQVNPEQTRGFIRAIISIYVQPPLRDAFRELLLSKESVEECYQVTGTQSHMIKVRCPDIEALDALINNVQKYGQTNTQIILSAMRGPAITESG